MAHDPYDYRNDWRDRDEGRGWRSNERGFADDRGRGWRGSERRSFGGYDYNVDRGYGHGERDAYRYTEGGRGSVAPDEEWGWQARRGHGAEHRFDRDDGRHEGGLLERTRETMQSWFGGEEGDYRGRGPKGYRRSDERIREDVSERLTDDPRLDASDIEVLVHDGEVTLSGTVNTREDKRRAERLVESCSGVGHVQNNLRVQQASGRDWAREDAEVNTDESYVSTSPPISAAGADQEAASILATRRR